jgi:C-terminal processing protease CtpA/Prc
MPAGNDYEFDLKTFIPVMNMGLTLGVKDKMIEITGVLPGTPAAKAGLTPGLIIQRIDGDDTSRMDLAMAKYMCGPIGGTADLELIDPATRQTKDVVLTTEKIFQ